MNAIKRFIIRRRMRKFLMKAWIDPHCAAIDTVALERGIFLATFTASDSLWKWLTENGFTPQFLSSIGVSRPSDQEETNSLPQ